MSYSLEPVISTLQRLLPCWPSIRDSVPGKNPNLYLQNIFLQLRRTLIVVDDLPKEPTMDCGLVFEELYRVVTKISSLVEYSGDISIPAEVRGEVFLETLLDLRWWTWIIALQAGMLVGDLYKFHFGAFEGVTLLEAMPINGHSTTRSLPSYNFELWQQETGGRLKGMLQVKSDGNDVMDQEDNEVDKLFTEIRNAEFPSFTFQHDLGPTILQDTGKPSSIHDYLEIDLTQDLLGASSTGYVIRTTVSDERGETYACALKRTNAVDEKPPDLARLWHPHVVHLRYYWREGGGRHDEEIGGSSPNSSTSMTFMVMELMHGDLAKLIKTRTKKAAGSAPFMFPVAVDLMLQIAKSMLYLHDMGVSHPHLRCENVLCRIESETETLRVGDVVVKLGGFGCSRSATVETKNWDVLCFGWTCLEILTGEVWSEDIQYGADKLVPRPSIPATTPPVLKRCIASCLNTELSFSGVVIMLRLAQYQIMLTCKDRTTLSSENIEMGTAQAEDQGNMVFGLASSSRSNDDLHEMFHVHQLHPQLGEAPTSVQITLIFFHGFPKVLEEWRMTWMTRDNKLLWPQKWLPEDLHSRDIRILAVSYNDHLKVSSNCTQSEMGENVLQKLVLSATWKLEETEAIVLVGHSFGGVIIKALVTEAQRALQNSINCQQVTKCKKFLKSLASIVFYSVPHALKSTEFENYISGCGNTRVLQKSSLLKSVRGDNCFIPEMIRLSRDFESAVPHRTKVLAFLEGKPMSKKCFLTEKPCEGQSLSWEWHKVGKDNHFEVCRPDSKSHTGYEALLQHLQKHVLSSRNSTFSTITEDSSDLVEPKGVQDPNGGPQQLKSTGSMTSRMLTVEEALAEAVLEDPKTKTKTKTSDLERVFETAPTDSKHPIIAAVWRDTVDMSNEVPVLATKDSMEPQTAGQSLVSAGEKARTFVLTLEEALEEAEVQAVKTKTCDLEQVLKIAAMDSQHPSLAAVWRDTSEMPLKAYILNPQYNVPALLIKNSVQPQAVGHALVLAACGGYINCVRHLREMQREQCGSVLVSRFNAFAFLKAAENGHQEVIRELLRPVLSSSTAMTAMMGYVIATRWKDRDPSAYPFVKQPAITPNKDWNTKLTSTKNMLPSAAPIFRSGGWYLQGTPEGPLELHNCIRSTYSIFLLWRAAVIAAAHYHVEVFKILLQQRALENTMLADSLHDTTTPKKIISKRAKMDTLMYQLVEELSTMNYHDGILYALWGHIQRGGHDSPRPETGQPRCVAQATNGLWEIQLEVPLLMMPVEHDLQKAEPFRRYKQLMQLFNQRAKVNIQLTAAVEVLPQCLQVEVGIKHVRFNVENSRWDPECMGHFPSFITLAVTPVTEEGTDVMLSNSTSNITVKIGRMERIQVGTNSGDGVSHGISGGMGLAAASVGVKSTMESKPWRFEQLAKDDRGGSFVWTLQSMKGVVFDRANPMLMVERDSKRRVGRLMPSNPLDELPFTREGGVNFTNAEFDDTMIWRFPKHMEGTKMRWNIEVQIHSTYTTTRYFETRMATCCGDIEESLEVKSRHGKLKYLKVVSDEKARKAAKGEKPEKGDERDKVSEGTKIHEISDEDCMENLLR
ncbi:hypothetical protein KC19_4G233800 [Ceratodon purpureus]|uniref:Protein kinase domain-containing protein n=1 Tax=Ceratodon purpureus TaxID=3225 RepID=A0A8T0IFE2_CERPU|nr:hypothetical protein KC19_4G233800 [Ceratodon purpureus]